MSALEFDARKRLFDETDWDFAGLTSSRGGAPLQGLHWYPASLLPALATSMLDCVAPRPGTLLDPFCGAGATLIEAWLRGHRTIGIDSNQTATAIVQAKVDILLAGTEHIARRLASDYLRFRTDDIGILRRLEPRELCKRFEIEPEAERWFEPEVLAEIAVIKRWMQVPDCKFLYFL